MKFRVVIPARFASSRLPGKPLADIGGKPMVVRVAKRAVEAGADEAIVATDDARVLEAVEAAGFRALMTAAHHQSGTDRLAEVAEMLERTGKDLGFPGQVYLKAESIEFCSAVLSRKMVEEDPRRIVNCPFIISVYLLIPTEPVRTPPPRQALPQRSRRSRALLGAAGLGPGAVAQSDSERAKLLFGLGMSLYGQSRSEESIQIWREGIELHRAKGPENSEDVAAYMPARLVQPGRAAIHH